MWDWIIFPLITLGILIALYFQCKKISNLAIKGKGESRRYGKNIIIGIVAAIVVIIVDKGVTLVFKDPLSIDYTSLLTIVTSATAAFIVLLFQIGLILFLALLMVNKGLEKILGSNEKTNFKNTKSSQERLVRVKKTEEYLKKGMAVEKIALKLRVSSSTIKKYIKEYQKPTEEKTPSIINKEQVSFLGIGLQWWIGIIVTIIISGFLANQLVQPLFSPRVADYEITPLYLQSISSLTNVEYFLISKISYSIDSPLFNFIDNDIELRLPKGEENVWSSNIDLMCNDNEFSPYIQLDFLGACNHTNYKAIEDIGAKINAKIRPSAFEAKKVKVNVYVRENLGRVYESSPTRDDHYWWSESTLEPNKIKKDVVSTTGHLLGFGIGGKNNLTYKFMELVIRNNLDLEIKGYKLEANLNQNVFNTICHDGFKLDTEIIDGDEYVSIDLLPRETKKILIIEIADEHLLKYTVNAVTFHFKTYNYCSDGWKKYQEYFR